MATHHHTIYHVTEAGGQHIAFAATEAEADAIVEAEYPLRYRHQATITPHTIEFEDTTP